MIDIPFTIFSFIGTILPLITLPWHLEQRHAAVLFSIGYLVLGNFLYFVNAIVFADPVDRAPWLCDITVHISFMMETGLIGSFVCIARWLYIIVSPNKFLFTHEEKRKMNIIDSLICIGIPIIFLVLSVLWQNQRYILLAPVGCIAIPFDYSWVSFAVYFIWPVVYSIIGAIFASLTLFYLWRRRKNLQECLASSMSGLNRGRFLRLSALCSFYIVFSLAITTSIFYLNWSEAQPMHPYSYKSVRSTWNIIVVTDIGRAPWQSYILFASSLIFFSFFGLGVEALATYKRWLKPLRLDKLTPSRWSQRKSMAPDVQVHAYDSGVEKSFTLSDRKSFRKHHSDPLRSDYTFDLDLESMHIPSDFKPAYIHSTKSINSSQSKKNSQNNPFTSDGIAVSVLESTIHTSLSNGLGMNKNGVSLTANKQVENDSITSPVCTHCQGVIVESGSPQSS